jgi:hypothetical protein
VTSHSWLLEPRTIVIFDIETVLDERAASAAGYKGSGMPSALQRIATACLFVATERSDGEWSGFRLLTFADPLSEFDVLMKLDETLADLADCKPLLGTYNGRSHDLAVLRRRAARHWMFGLPGIAAAGTIDHVDIMLRQRLGRRDATPTLREACAGLGISAYDSRKFSGPSVRSDVMKCQIDVVATFVLMLFELAIERASPDVLLAGWEGLSKHLAGLRPMPRHLEHFRNHPLLRAAREARTNENFDV